MIKYTKFFITLLLAVIVFEAKSQSTATTSSPYSQFGLGDLTPQWLPQNAAMGGIATGINKINGYNTINSINPASYAAIDLTTIDIGLYGNIINLNQTGQSSQTNSNFRLSHIAFAIPVAAHSAFSFGLMPYTELGYNYTITSPNFGTKNPADTVAVHNIYSGEGSLSKAYIGYGTKIVKGLMVGFNASYIFGDLKHYRSTEYDALGTLNSRDEQDLTVGGINFDYGAQYQIDLSATRHIVLGYSGSLGSKIGAQSTHIVSQYSIINGSQNTAADTLVNTKGTATKIQLPQINHFGISYQKDQKYLIGADYSTGHWSDLSIGGVNQGMANSSTLNMGGQYTPNINALGNYWATIDYRLGLIFDQSYYNIANSTGSGYTNIKSHAVTFGLGMPLASRGMSFYKVNFSAEVGQRGTLNNGLVKENYINLHLGFTLNDKWFQRYKFD
ncbi:hypothetical protein [Mucilaginibacter sp.]|uniref:hypothetical protein n=1 Tax=Mucilaginibacter sp. TaxID=1882438 RepID=UPI0026337717|nr:hypothetical protein [Mucilaginibacter sp.]MDB5030930.1 hypothetical protein [Mucilaginibacter sp.]